MARPVNQDRQNAIELGLRTYTGSPHSKCGTTERYVAGGGCVHCAREIATAQRLALKAQRTEAVNQSARKSLDNEKTPQQIAREAFNKSIEDDLF